MKVLLTGSHGFVGTNLFRALSPRHEIIRWNIREDEVLPDVDAVIHLAGLAHDTDHTKDEKDYYEVNTELTKRIYDRFKDSTAKKFIFFSSIKAKDNDTPYAKSKRLAEEYILSHADLIKSQTDITDTADSSSQAKKVYILRPCMIHGKGNKGNLNLLVKWVKEGWPWPLAAYENKRSFASMENVSFIVEKLLSSKAKSGIYNICDDEPLSTNDLVGLICLCMGKKPHLWRIPKIIMASIAKVGDELHLPLNSERLDKLTRDNIVDNSNIKHALGLENLPIDVKEGLARSIMRMEI